MGHDAMQAGTILPEIRISASRPVEAAENQVHDDRVARSLGFTAGLVPGFIVYAWMTRPVVAALGPGWLASGTFSVRFAHPIYYDDEAVIRARVTSCTGDLVTIDVQALNASGTACATARLGLPAAPPEAPDLTAYPAAALPHTRPRVSREHLERLERLGALGAPELLVDETAAGGFLRLVGESLPTFAGPAAPVHPGLYLDQANCAFDRNVYVNPWLHVESHGRHLSIARVGERLATRGKIASLFNRKGHEFAELDLLVLAGDARASRGLVPEGGDARPVASIRHVAIYKLRQAS